MKDIKLAISVSGAHVSKRFDCAHDILFVNLVGGEEVSRRLVPTCGMSGIKLMQSILDEGIEVIVCCGMPEFYRRMAEANGIEVVNSAGPVDEILDSVKKGEKPPDRPSCSHGGRGHGFGHGNGCETGKRQFDK